MRALILSDIHANPYALKVVLDDAPSYDEVIVLGDLVDYGPRPAEVIDEVRSIGAEVIRGNHDEAVAKGIDCGCGPATHNLSVLTRERISYGTLSKADIVWLDTLPYELSLGWGLAVHAAPSNKLYTYVYPWMSNEEICRELVTGLRRLALRGCEGVEGIYLLGHTHHQFLRRLPGGTTVINPGSVGQPRDWDPRAAYALLEVDGDVVSSIEFRRVRYDVDALVRDLRELLGPGKEFEDLAQIYVTGSIDHLVRKG